MGIHTTLIQGLLQIILVSLLMYATLSHGSALSDNTSLCPRGWYHYERFCVTRGQGSSDRAIALYCDGFGGIGIKGLCIIRVHTNDPASNLVQEDSAVNFSQGLPVSASNNLGPSPENDPVYATASDDESQLSPYRDSAQEDAASSNFLDMGIFGNRVEGDSGVCPNGWTHYRSMCIYRPWSVAERCHLMNAVEFQGLCIKHADTVAEVNKHLSVRSKEKRICCCASFKAKGNNYGC